MKRLSNLKVIIVISLIITANLAAQVDEISDATGMPIAIGAPVIYGQVAIEGIRSGERRPNIFVSLLLSGTQVDRRQTDGRGYFFFLQTPRHGHTLVFEINGGEVGRAYLTVGTGNRLRQDVTIDLKSLQGAPERGSAPGVVSAGSYPRSAEMEKAFDKGMSAVRQGKSENAAAIFNDIVVKDPNDYIAWTMLGTIYYSDKKYANATPAFAKALELKPDFTLARVNLGRMELNLDKGDKAIETLKIAVETDPQSADANHFMGEAYLQAKKGSLAVGFLNKALEISPVQKAEIHLRLAALYNGAGLKDRAAAEYKAFLEKVPDHADKKKFEQYIKDNSPR